MTKKLKNKKKKDKQVDVDNKVKRKPVYEDRRNTPNIGGRPRFDEEEELDPEYEEMCVLVAEGLDRREVLERMPSLTKFRYNNAIARPRIQERIDEIRAEMLLTNAEQLEPVMFGLVAALARYFKRKAARLDLAEPVAEKLMDRSLRYCEARMAIDKKALKTANAITGKIKGKKGDDGLKKLEEALDQPLVDQRKPIWDSEDYDDPNVNIEKDKEGKKDND